MQSIDNIQQATRRSMTAHSRQYTFFSPTDLFKFIFQSSFGCEHIISDEQSAVDYIRREYSSLDRADTTALAPLDGDYTRVSLSVIDDGLSEKTLGRLLALSAKREPNGKEKLLAKIEVARELAREGAFPFTEQELDLALDGWRDNGYPSVHHSDRYRQEYHPAYRVIDNRFVKFLPLFTEIDKMLKKGRVTLAIDGGSASGKSTLSDMLASVYGCTVFHIDDYFLRPEQRTPARFAEIGGNFDRERFLAEILLPLSRGEEITYHRFNCSTLALEEAVTVTPTPLSVIEGAYSMHPELEEFYNLTVFLSIGEDKQKERILIRNGEPLASRFFGEWIPLEHKYFDATNILGRADIVIEI